MSDYADGTIHRFLIGAEREQAHQSVIDTRRRLEALAEDLGTKADVLEECDATELLMFALDLERTALELRICAERLNRAMGIIDDETRKRARLNGHEI